MATKNPLKLNPFLQPEDAPFPNRPERMLGFAFDKAYEVQARDIRAADMVKISNYASGIGEITNGTQAVIITTLSQDNQFLNNFNLGVPHIAVYEGTVASTANKIFPSPGVNIPIDKYNIFSGYDYELSNGTNSVYCVTLQTNVGTTIPIFVELRWRFMQNNAGRSQP